MEYLKKNQLFYKWFNLKYLNLSSIFSPNLKKNDCNYIIHSAWDTITSLLLNPVVMRGEENVSYYFFVSNPLVQLHNKIWLNQIKERKKEASKVQ